MGDDKDDLVERTITIRQWRFSIRELVLLVSAFLAVLLMLIFAGLFGQTTSELTATHSRLSSATREQCLTKACFQTHAHMEEFLNGSTDPCDNFYQFACGGYKDARKLEPGRDGYKDVFQELSANNEAALRTLLISGKFPHLLDESSAERKLKMFFSSCADDFEKEKRKGKPIVDALISNLGGSYLLGSKWEEANWDFNDALSRTLTDLWVDALYEPRVNTDQTDSTRRVIALYPGGTGRYMLWRDYLTTTDPKKQKLQSDYQKFMRTVATLISRDAGVSSDQDLDNRIGVFVNDAFTVEQKIATFASDLRYSRDAYSEAKKMTLDQIKQTQGSEIDWTGQMAYLFNTAGVSGSTKVVEPYPSFISNLTAMVRGLDPQSRNRMLHNYLTWRVLEVYIQDLSGEYVHANRQVYVDKFGYSNFLGTQRYCFSLAKRYFDIALGALYVYTNFDKKNKDKVTEITEMVKTAIEDTITANDWMDQTTKDYAMQKLRGSTFKIGYPDFMDDETQVDAIYSQVTINDTDFLGNLLIMNQEQRREWNRRLLLGEDRSQWIYDTYSTNLAVYLYWDEIIAPAGILQFPLYTYDMPHYYSFGAIGSIFGHYVHHLIDEMGRKWDKGGDYMDTDNGWWSNATVTKFNAAKQCVADLYNNVTQGPYFSLNGKDYTVDVDGDQYAGEAMTITTGIRLAYTAYKAWQAKYGADPSPPGLKYTPEQLFFVAHAQLYCYNRDPFYDYFYTRFYANANEETQVNLALQELPEFSQAFGCQATDKMVPATRCKYY